MLWLKTGVSESVTGLGRTALLETSEAQGGSVPLELVKSLLLGQELSWTDFHCWRDTVEESSFVAGMEAVVEEVEVLVWEMTEE